MGGIKGIGFPWGVYPPSLPSPNQEHNRAHQNGRAVGGGPPRRGVYFPKGTAAFLGVVLGCSYPPGFQPGVVQDTSLKSKCRLGRHNNRNGQSGFLTF